MSEHRNGVLLVYALEHHIPVMLLYGFKILLSHQIEAERKSGLLQDLKVRRIEITPL